MKKQTKLVATLSTAALLALGFSAVSMAAGWDNSTGAWRYLNNDGTEVTDEWKSANGNWFYLDSDGVMATDKLIEDDSAANGKTKYYYVDQYGAMVKNTWKAVAMDDDDNSDLDAEYWWYYFGNDGKAYTTERGKDLTKNQIKTINGLKYGFDDEGHMLYGWTLKDDHTQDDSDTTRWQDATYYFNGWNDGHAQTGWAQINVEKTDGDTEDYWFYFNGDGEKQCGKDGYAKRKKINGVYYVFAEDGHMVDEWATAAGTKNASWSDSIAEYASFSDAKKISYLNGDGSQRKNTWVYAIPDEDWLNEDYNDDEYRWFYFNKSGALTVNEIKKINGKKYAFDRYGRMKAEFVKDTANAETNTGREIVGIGGGDDWTREQWIAGNNTDGKTFGTADVTNGDKVYYFSGDSEKDGAQKTGYQNIELSDDTYQFYFDTKSGEGKTGYNSKINKFTVKGLILKPTNDDDNNYAGLKNVTVNVDPTTKKVTYDITGVAITTENIGANDILVNKQGTIVKNKTVHDENDVYYRTDANGVVKKVADKDTYDSIKNTTWKND